MQSFERGIFFAIIPWVALATICDDKPSLLQCVALKYQFILPIKESCNPLKRDCQTGDLIDPRVANCHLQLNGNTFHSLVNNFQLSSGYRCFPNVPEPDVFHKRNVGPSYGEPRCVPTDFKRSGSFLCGEHGTRCVCDAPKETGYGEQWWGNSCRSGKWLIFFVPFSSLKRNCWLIVGYNSMPIFYYCSIDRKYLSSKYPAIGPFLLLVFNLFSVQFREKIVRLTSK